MLTGIQLAENTFACSSLATNNSAKQFSEKNAQQTIRKCTVHMYLKKVFKTIFVLYTVSYTNILWTVSDRILKQSLSYTQYHILISCGLSMTGYLNSVPTIAEFPVLH